MTRLPVSEVVQDVRAFGIDFRERKPFWIASEGGELRFNYADLNALSVSIKETLRKNSDRRIRIVTDVLSSILLLNPTETIYKFLSQLFAEIKHYDAVVVAIVEEGMHQPQALAAIQQLFDGIIELKLYEESLRVVPLLRVRKMRGQAPKPAYYNFSFSKSGMEVSAYVK